MLWAGQGTPTLPSACRKLSVFGVGAEMEVTYNYSLTENDLIYIADLISLPLSTIWNTRTREEVRGHDLYHIIS